ncbi:MAG TPA: hypothetical protein VF546_13020 [Pyrinomonadaceae bacterium]|jgi:chromosome segregation ATPase
MDESFITTLDETTGRYIREALADADTDNKLCEQLAEVRRQASEVVLAVEAGASPDATLAFTREFDSFLNKAKAKALKAKRIETDIKSKQVAVAETQAEIERLSDSLPALADAVNRALDKYEEVRHDYNEREFKIATLLTRLSMRRGELVELRRHLAQLKVQEVQK